jgi:hypothetical protein
VELYVGILEPLEYELPQKNHNLRQVETYFVFSVKRFDKACRIFVNSQHESI